MPQNELNIDQELLDFQLEKALIERGRKDIFATNEELEPIGEVPPLTEPQKQEILTAHRIHCGKVSRCSICGHPLPNVKGCFACSNCGSTIGVCG